MSSNFQDTAHHDLYAKSADKKLIEEMVYQLMNLLDHVEDPQEKLAIQTLIARAEKHL